MCRVVSFAASCMHTSLCVHRKTHKEGMLSGSRTALAVPAHLSQRWHWKEGLAFQLRVHVHGENATPREALRLISAIGATPQQKMGMSNGGAAFGSKVAISYGLPAGSTAVTGGTGR